MGVEDRVLAVDCDTRATIGGTGRVALVGLQVAAEGCIVAFIHQHLTARATARSKGETKLTSVILGCHERLPTILDATVVAFFLFFSQPSRFQRCRLVLLSDVFQKAITSLLTKVEAVVPYDRGDLLSRVHELGACDTEEYTDAGTFIQVPNVFTNCRFCLLLPRLLAERIYRETGIALSVPQIR